MSSSKGVVYDDSALGKKVVWTGSEYGNDYENVVGTVVDVRNSGSYTCLVVRYEFGNHQFQRPTGATSNQLLYATRLITEL